MFGGLFNRNRNAPKASAVWPRTIGLAEFSSDTPNGLAITAGVWYTWRYRVPAQQVIKFGTGSVVNGVDNRGVLMVHIEDSAGANLAGSSTVQIGYENANQTNFLPIWEGRADQIDDVALASIRNSNNTLGEIGPGARQDSYLVIRVKPSGTLATAFADATSDFRVPVTIYTL